MVCSRNELPPLRSSFPGIRRIAKRGIQRGFTICNQNDKRLQRAGPVFPAAFYPAVMS